MLNPRSHQFTLLLGAITAITALSIDMSLPALPSLRETFHAGSGQAQLTLTLFLWGYALSQFLSGPLSDWRGRKPILLIGLAIYTAAGIGCLFSQSLPMLAGFRLIQGLGAGVGPVIGRAIVRDTYERQEATVVFSQITQVMIVAPMAAPVLGGFLLTHFSWRAIFLVLTAAGIALWLVCRIVLAEPSRHNVATGSGLEFAHNCRLFFANPVCFGNLLLICFSYAGMFAYISGSPFVLMDLFGVAKQQFGYYFAATAFSLLIGATLNKSLAPRLRSETILQIGMAAIVSAGALIALAVWLHIGGLWGIILPMIAYLFGMGLAIPHATAAAMEPYPRMAGLASSIIGCLQTASGGLSGYIAARYYDHTPHSLGTMVAAMAAGMLLVSLRYMPSVRRISRIEKSAPQITSSDAP